MASQPLRRALLRALDRRAQSQLGAAATPLEYVEFWLGSRQTFQGLSRDIETDLGRPVSRKFVSFVCNRLTADARRRIRAARPALKQRFTLDDTATMSGDQPDRQITPSSCAN